MGIWIVAELVILLKLSSAVLKSDSKRVLLAAGVLLVKGVSTLCALILLFSKVCSSLVAGKKLHWYTRMTFLVLVYFQFSDIHLPDNFFNISLIAVIVIAH